MIGIIIQARTGSSRLPNKMILPFFEGKGILETILLRIKEIKLDVPVILATTTNPSDDILADIALNQNISVFRGNEHNVLKRFIRTGEKYNLDKIIRICADNPFLSMTDLEKQIMAFEKMDVDYWCYSKSDGTPTILTHYGFWTEGVKLSALKIIAEYTNDKHYLEHVTNFLYSNQHLFSIHYEPIDKDIEEDKDVRLTIDTHNDFILGQKIYGDLQETNLPITAINILAYLKKRPEYLNTMKNEIAKNLK